MAEYKDVELLRKQIAEFKMLVESSENSDYLKGYITGKDAVMEAIDELPAADVQEVVRCKDCNYYDMQNCYCEMFDFDTPSDDFYCREGERMDGDKR